jgi:hypothetical protein
MVTVHKIDTRRLPAALDWGGYHTRFTPVAHIVVVGESPKDRLMRNLMILLAACILPGCATMQDPNIWGAFATGTAPAPQQQETPPTHCQSVASGGVLETDCR